MYREFQRTESRNTMNLTQAPVYTPDETAATSLLQYLNSEQLQEYLNDSSKIDAIIEDLPQTKSMKRDLENMSVKNRSLAEYNMNLRPKFESLKANTAEDYKKVNELKMSLGKDIATLDSLAGNQSQDTMLAIFQTECATMDEESEDVASNFCDGNVDIETFISDYLPKRTEAYSRKAKLEKLTDLIRHGEPLQSAYSSVPSAQHMPSKPMPGHSNMGAGYGAPYPTPYPPTHQFGGMPHPYR